MDNTRIIFIHGSGGDKSQTYKARLLREQFPGMLTPDFDGDLAERMIQLEKITSSRSGWILIGSSLGGLMAALIAVRFPERVSRLILLAPALTQPEFSNCLPSPILIPTVIIHGTRDEILPLKENRTLAEKVFKNLNYMVVDDDHRLHATADSLDWKILLE